MDKARVFLIALVTIPVVGGLAIGSNRTPAQEARMQAAQDQAHIERNAEAMVRLALKDPDSATFRHVKPGTCGYVNARNGFGGYTGEQRFLVAVQGPVLEEQVTDRGAFEQAWREHCTPA